MDAGLSLELYDLVSVLIATFNRPSDLLKCIQSILSNDHKNMEIIIVDQSETPIVFDGDKRVRVLHSLQKGKSRALNLAIAEAKGNILAFTDDDCTVPTTWISRGIEMVNNQSNVGLVFGALVAAPHDATRVMIPIAEFPELEVQMGQAAATVHGGGAGANMFAKKETIETLGGFDEVYGPGAELRSCEELDLYIRTLSAEKLVIRDPHNAVVHWGAREIANGSAERLIRDYFFGEAAVLGKHCRKQNRRAWRISLGVFRRNVYWGIRNFFKTGPNDLVRLSIWARGFVAGLCWTSDHR
jgi:glycosyltransferase involved in cell wall biosynthesis